MTLLEKMFAAFFVIHTAEAFLFNFQLKKHNRQRVAELERKNEQYHRERTLMLECITMFVEQQRDQFEQQQKQGKQNETKAVSESTLSA